MKPAKGVIEALNACLKYERTLEDCHQHYAIYFKRQRFFRLFTDFRDFAREARHRKKHLMMRIAKLDSIESSDRYPYDVVTLDKPGEIDDVMKHFDTMLSEARQTYEKARETCSSAGDSVSSKLLGRHKCEIEHDLARFEAKRDRIKLIGAEAYLAHHMHMEN